MITDQEHLSEISALKRSKVKTSGSFDARNTYVRLDFPQTTVQKASPLDHLVNGSVYRVFNGSVETPSRNSRSTYGKYLTPDAIDFALSGNVYGANDRRPLEKARSGDSDSRKPEKTVPREESLRTFNGRVEAINGDLARVTMRESATDEPLFGDCHASTLAAAGIGTGDLFRMEIKRLGGEILVRFQRVFRPNRSAEDVASVWRSIADLE
jgi:hypothetical protein